MRERAKRLLPARKFQMAHNSQEVSCKVVRSSHRESPLTSPGGRGRLSLLSSEGISWVPSTYKAPCGNSENPLNNSTARYRAGNAGASPCAYVYIHRCMHVHKYTLHVCMHAETCVHTHTYICTNLHIHTYFCFLLPSRLTASCALHRSVR